MADFFYDEFDNESIDARWSEGAGSGSVTEQNDRFEMTTGHPTTYSWNMSFDTESFDAWTLVEIPAYDTSGDVGVGLYLEDISTEEYCSCILFRESINDWWEMRGAFGNGGSDIDYITDVAVVSNKVWLRMRYRPEEGDTRVHAYYALSDPFVGSWTEFVTTKDPQLTNGNYRFTLRGTNTQSVDRTVYFYNITEIAAATTTTTTASTSSSSSTSTTSTTATASTTSSTTSTTTSTTSTTTTVSTSSSTSTTSSSTSSSTTTTYPPLQYDEFDNASLESFWTWDAGIGAAGSMVEEDGFLKITSPNSQTQDYHDPPRVFQWKSGDFDVWVKVHATWDNNYKWAGIMAATRFGSGNYEYVVAAKEARGGGTCVFKRGDLSNTAGDAQTFTGAVTCNEHAYVRLKRVGSTFTAYYSRYPYTGWTTLANTPSEFSISGPVMITLFSIDQNQATGANQADYYYFRAIDTPPTTTTSSTTSTSTSSTSSSTTTSTTVTINPLMTWDPNNTDASITLSNGNLTGRGSTTGPWRSTRATRGWTSGKYYWEVTIDDDPGASSAMVGIGHGDMATTNFPGGGTDGVGYYEHTGVIYYAGSGTAYGDTYTTNDIIGVALDLDNGKVFFSKNGVYQNEGDPVAGTNPAKTITPSEKWWPWHGFNYNLAEVTVNFGESDFATDPPTGYSPPEGSGTSTTSSTTSTTSTTTSTVSTTSSTSTTASTASTSSSTSTTSSTTTTTSTTASTSSSTSTSTTTSTTVSTSSSTSTTTHTTTTTTAPPCGLTPTQGVSHIDTRVPLTTTWVAAAQSVSNGASCLHIDNFAIRLDRVGSDGSAKVYVSLVNTKQPEGNVPNDVGGVKWSAEINFDDVSTSDSWHTFYPNIDIDAGNELWIVVRHDTAVPLTNYIQMPLSYGNPYANGRSMYKHTTTGWNVGGNSADDHNFRINQDYPTTTSTSSSTTSTTTTTASTTSSTSTTTSTTVSTSSSTTTTATASTTSSSTSSSSSTTTTVPCTFYWDFENYSTGSEPSDWTRRDAKATDPPHFDIVSKSTPYGGTKAMEIENADGHDIGMSPDEVGSVLDSDQVMLFQIGGKTAAGGTVLNARRVSSGGGEYETHYWVEFTGLSTNQQVSLERHNAGAVTWNTSMAVPMVVGQWYWLRFQCVDGPSRVEIAVKWWPHGDSEPENFQLSWWDSSAERLTAPGYVGPSNTGTDANEDINVAWYSVGINGCAPLMPEDVGLTTSSTTTTTTTASTTSSSATSSTSSTTTTSSSTSSTISTTSSTASTVSTTSSSTTTTTYPPVPGPDLWYRFSDDIIDYSGNGHHGTVLQSHHGSLQFSDMDTANVNRAVGPQPDTGTYSPCVGVPASFTGWHGLGKTWTCNIWVKTHVVEYDNSSYYICAFGDYYNARMFQVIYSKPLQKVYVNTYNVSTYMTDVLAKESEVMLTYRYNGDDGASSTIDCFVDGQFYVTHNIGERLTLYFDDYHCIAGGENGHDLFLCGNLVGDFRIYTEALNDHQIEELYGDQFTSTTTTSSSTTTSTTASTSSSTSTTSTTASTSSSSSSTSTSSTTTSSTVSTSSSTSSSTTTSTTGSTTTSSTFSTTSSTTTSTTSSTSTTTSSTTASTTSSTSTTTSSTSSTTTTTDPGFVWPFHFTITTRQQTADPADISWDITLYDHTLTPIVTANHANTLTTTLEDITSIHPTLPYTPAELALFEIDIEMVDTGGTSGIVTELEVVYYQNAVPQTVLYPGSDLVTNLQTTGAPHYDEINNGISTPVDAAFVFGLSNGVNDRYGLAATSLTTSSTTTSTSTTSTTSTSTVTTTSSSSSTTTSATASTTSSTSSSTSSTTTTVPFIETALPASDGIVAWTAVPPAPPGLVWTNVAFGLTPPNDGAYITDGAAPPGLPAQFDFGPPPVIYPLYDVRITIRMAIGPVAIPPADHVVAWLIDALLAPLSPPEMFMNSGPGPVPFENIISPGPGNVVAGGPFTPAQLTGAYIEINSVNSGAGPIEISEIFFEFLPWYPTTSSTSTSTSTSTTSTTSSTASTSSSSTTTSSTVSTSSTTSSTSSTTSSTSSSTSTTSSTVSTSSTTSSSTTTTEPLLITSMVPNNDDHPGTPDWTLSEGSDLYALINHHVETPDDDKFIRADSDLDGDVSNYIGYGDPDFIGDSISFRYRIRMRSTALTASVRAFSYLFAIQVAVPVDFVNTQINTWENLTSDWLPLERDATEYADFNTRLLGLTASRVDVSELEVEILTPSGLVTTTSSTTTTTTSSTASTTSSTATFSTTTTFTTTSTTTTIPLGDVRSVIEFDCVVTMESRNFRA